MEAKSPASHVDGGLEPDAHDEATLNTALEMKVQDQCFRNIPYPNTYPLKGRNVK